MRVISKILSLLILCVFLLACLINSANAQENIVRAKIGIQIRAGERIVRARSQESLNAGDLIRIYVHPENKSYIYVVHSDLNEAALLNIVQQKTQSSTLVMPSLQEFYQVDGKREKEIFTIVISPNVLPEVSDLLGTGNAPYSKWVEIERMLLDKSRIDLAQDVNKPFPITGNVRGGEVGDIDPFVSEIMIFSGKSILVKKYEFKVEN